MSASSWILVPTRLKDSARGFNPGFRLSPLGGVSDLAAKQLHITAQGFSPGQIASEKMP